MQSDSFYSDFKAQGFYSANQVEMRTNSGEVPKLIASMVYVLFVVLFIVIFLLVWLIWRRNALSFANSVTITTGGLFFLPIFLFTFRTSIAPNYLTPVDTCGFLLILLHEILLCPELFMNRRKEKPPLDRIMTNLMHYASFGGVIDVCTAGSYEQNLSASTNAFSQAGLF